MVFIWLLIAVGGYNCLKVDVVYYCLVYGVPSCQFPPVLILGVGQQHLPKSLLFVCVGKVLLTFCQNVVNIELANGPVCQLCQLRNASIQGVLFG